MLHPRYAIANEFAQRLIWAAVLKYPDLPLIEAIAKKAQELHHADVFTQEQLQDVFAVVGCLDTTEFASSGELDGLVGQCGLAFAACRDSLSSSELKRLV